ncbi:MAG: phosphatase PAP2 family protein [Planctomycetota bacterium]
MHELPFAAIARDMDQIASRAVEKTQKHGFWGMAIRARGLATFLICAVAIALSFLLDGWVADQFAKPIRSGQVRAVLTNLRIWGEGATLLIISIGIALAQPRQLRGIVTVLAATLVCASIVEGVKPHFGRMRPSEARVNPAEGNWQFRSGRNSSFPSGHTATAFAFGRGLSLLVPSLKPLCLVAATGTAVSRMHEQRHYFSDCMVGALFGWFASGWVWMLINRVEQSLARSVLWPWHRSLTREGNASLS